MTIEVDSMDEWHKKNEDFEAAHDQENLQHIRELGFDGSDDEVLAAWHEYALNSSD